MSPQKLPLAPCYLTRTSEGPAELAPSGRRHPTHGTRVAFAERIMVALISSARRWKPMTQPIRPVVFVVGETEVVRQWIGILNPTGVEPRMIRSVVDYPREDESPGCVLMPLTSERELDGLHACARWMALGDERPLIVLANSPELARLLKRLVGERIDVFDSSEPFDAIVARVVSVAMNDVERQVRRAAWSEISERFRLLTTKDREVLDMLLEGLPNKSIAMRLAVTERAIEMRRASLMKKLQARSHAELIRLVTRYEVVTRFGLALPFE